MEGLGWPAGFYCPFARLLASHTDYNFPFFTVLRRLPPARHCLIVCRGKLLEEINLPLTLSWEFLYQSPQGMPGAGQAGVRSRQYNRRRPQASKCVKQGPSWTCPEPSWELKSCKDLDLRDPVRDSQSQKSQETGR